MQNRLNIPVFNALLASSAAGLMCGCSGRFAPSPIQPNKTPIGNIQGSVHGGQAPISRAKIYLFVSGEGGNATNPVSLITSTAPDAFEDGNGHYYVVTDANGSFTLGGDYTCTAGQQVYMVAMGDDPSLAGTMDNAAIVRMAGLGKCPAVGNMAAQVPYLVINEVTTAAFAYAMGEPGPAAFNVSANAANKAEGSLTQLLGLATPTATPFSGGDAINSKAGINQTRTIQNGDFGTKP
jgi:hypothetical protein